MLKFRANTLRQKRIFRFLYLARRIGTALIINKRVQKKVLECSLKNNRMISVPVQGKSINITAIQVYALTSNTEKAKVEWFYEDLQDLLEIIP